MRNKRSHGNSLHFILMYGIIAATGSFLLWHFVLAQGAQSVPLLNPVAPVEVPYVQEKIGLPERIKIPSLNLDAVIENVGLTSGGAMGVAKDPLHAGWYDLGPRPGEKGSAVIDGHVNWYYGATGAFADLHLLKLGDEVHIQDEAGVDLVFVVREIRTYDSKADATDVFISHDGKAHLNLITCDGVWNKDAHEYSKRLIVFTDQSLE